MDERFGHDRLVDQPSRRPRRRVPFGWIPILAVNGLLIGSLFGTIAYGAYCDKGFLREFILLMEDDPFPWNTGSWVGAVVGTIVGLVAGAHMTRQDPQGPFFDDE